MTKKLTSFILSVLLILVVHILLLLHWPLYSYAENALHTTYNGMPRFILKAIGPYVFSIVVFLAFYFTVNQKFPVFLGRCGGIVIAVVMVLCVPLIVFQVLYHVARLSIPPSMVPYMEENGWMLSMVIVFDVIVNIVAIRQRKSNK